MSSDSRVASSTSSSKGASLNPISELVSSTIGVDSIPKLKLIPLVLKLLTKSSIL